MTPDVTAETTGSTTAGTMYGTPQSELPSMAQVELGGERPLA
jgi:hypothetical protein